MDKWTNTFNIMEDLSVAQGRIVPASLKATFGNSRPPASRIIEDTEEEYYKCGTSDGDYSSGPDISLIQEMLSLVKGNTVSADDDADNVIVVSKLNPTCPEFVPTNVKTEATKPQLTQTKPKKNRWERNVVLSALLSNLEKEAEKRDGENIKQETISVTLSTKKLPLSECFMFRRKNVKKSKQAVTPPITCKQQQNYVPSELAKDYYEKYLENSKKQMMRDNLWTRLEKEMKVIDERQKRELSSPSASTSSQASGDDSSTSSTGCESGVETLNLPLHRHLLMSGVDCVVCLLVKKHGYNIM